MKITSRTLLGLALMGALAVVPSLTNVAHADAPDAPDVTNRDDRDFDRNDADRRDDFDGRERGNRRDDERGRAGFDRRDARGPGPRGARDERGPGRGGPENEGRANFGRRGDRGGPAQFEGRDNERGRADFGRRGPNRDENANGRNRIGRPDEELTIVPQFTGVVTKVKSDREFDVRINDKTYNVYLTGATNAVSVGQTVGLNGQRIGTNDIRSATLLQGRRR